MKATFKTLTLMMAVMLLIGTLTGCSLLGGGGGKADTVADQPAIQYATNVCNGKWDEVLKASTGDQLAIYMQLIPVLKTMNQTTELKRIEVVDRAISSDKNLAFVTVHVVKTVTIPDYGSVLDDKQVLLSMKVIDGQWKVFKMDVVNDIKSNLSK